jgi:ferredoxin-type protein NapH
MMKDIDERGHLARYRYWIMAAGALLFLPPLSFLFQFTGDSNFCGSWCPRMFLVWRQGMTPDAFLAGLQRSYMGAALVLAILLTTLIAGRHWCSHLCPIGGLMELGSRLTPGRLQLDFSRIPAAPFRYGYLAVYFIAPMVGLGSLCCNYCNFAVIPRLLAAPFSGADMAYFLRTAGLINLGLLLVLGFFAKGGRAYCNLLCPIGALDALVNRARGRLGWRVQVESSRCTGCNLCKQACPTWAISVEETAKIDQLSCMPCRICEDKCPTGAISYGKG